MATDRLGSFAGFAQLIDSQLPTALIKRPNPLFERQLKRLSWPLSGRMTRYFEPISKTTLLRRYTYVGCLIGIVAILPFIGMTVGTLRDDFTQPALLIILGFSVLADIYYMMAAINTLVAQIKDTQWELLRLTSLTEADILLASYATIQVRVWRVTVVETAMRIFLCLIPILNFGYSVFSNRIKAFYAGYILSLLVVGIGWILEPLWRMRAVTLLAMTVAAWFSDFGMAVIVTFAGVVALLATEVAILAGLLALFNSRALTFIDLYASTVEATLKLEILSLIMFTVILVAVRYYFKTVSAFLFRRLKRVAFR